MTNAVLPDAGDIAGALKLGLRRLAKAVVVVTAHRGDARAAMTATAVSELSLDPPSLLVCANRSASMFPLLKDGADFCVNILDASHRAIADRCAGGAAGDARFAEGDWRQAANGGWVLGDAQASFACAFEQAHFYGTHGIFIGRVIDVRIAGEVGPLIYVDGTFRS
ncbi:flavin reductase family protein [Sphingopyxis granuli]|uniref:flavin reductase family protein n=1 Tax=Sphingopyxis granuli TaxID=267128 RepID=UPI001F5302D4|nr:flavin reductase family protein [Sphingopyxis granuli]UNK79216.1 flavin reductase family protein [Sphingopyxis granuli]